MRTHPNKKLGHIIIPVILDEQSSDKVNDAFKQIVNVVAAVTGVVVACATSRLSKSASHSARVRDRTLYNQYRLTRQIPPEQKPYQ